MKNLPIFFLLSAVFLLMGAAIVANVDGGRIELRGAWLAKGGK